MSTISQISKNLRLLLLAMVLFSSVLSDRTTLQIITLVNQGSSYPSNGSILKYLSAPQRDYLIKLGATDSNLQGKLTANGHRMMYKLGSLLKNKFPSFFKSSINHLNQINVLASSKSANSLSAQALLLGLYEKFDNQSFDFSEDYSVPEFDEESPDDSKLTSSLPDGYYPFAVNQVSQHFNDMFEPFNTSNCNSFTSFSSSQTHSMDKYLHSANEIVKENPQIGKIIQELNKDSLKSSPLSTNEELKKLVDYMSSMRFIGADLGVDSSVFSSLQMLNTLVQSIYMFQPKGIDINLSQLSSFLKKNISKAQKSMKDASQEFPSFVLLSGNKYNLWAFLQNLNLSNTKCLEKIYEHQLDSNCYLEPTFGSSLIFEVYKEDTSKNLLIGILSFA
jgi:hypothetical protein